VSDFVQHREETPTIEVRVFRYGVLVASALCESEEEAALAVDEWSEIDGVECEVDDLTFHHRPGEVFEPEPAVDLSIDDLVEGVEDDAPRARRS
jgi:hypothetical protein